MSDEEIKVMRERLSKMETAIGMNDSDSGLRGDMKKIERHIGTLFDRISASEKRFAMMVGGGAVILWIINRVFP